MEGIWKARRHSALSFDEIDDYCNCGSDESLNMGYSDFTLEAWVKLNDTTGAKNALIDKANEVASTGYSLAVRWNSVYLWIAAEGEYIASVVGSVQPNKWYHIVGVFDRDYKAIAYINTQKFEGYDISSLSSKSADTDAVCYVCRPGRLVNGLIASARIYNCALSDSEVKYLYYNPDDPLDTDHLVLWLHPGSIDTDAGYWWDISGRDNHSQIFGATKVSLVSPEVTVL